MIKILYVIIICIFLIFLAEKWFSWDTNFEGFNENKKDQIKHFVMKIIFDDIILKGYKVNLPCYLKSRGLHLLYDFDIINGKTFKNFFKNNLKNCIYRCYYFKGMNDTFLIQFASRIVLNELIEQGYKTNIICSDKINGLNMLRDFKIIDNKILDKYSKELEKCKYEQFIENYYIDRQERRLAYYAMDIIYSDLIKKYNIEIPIRYLIDGIYSLYHIGFINIDTLKSYYKYILSKR